MEKLAIVLKAIFRKSAYLLVNVLLFFFAFLFIFRGYRRGDTSQRDALYLSIGSSLAAAGIVALVDLWKELSKSRLLERVSNVIFDAGVQHVYRKRDLDRYDILMGKLASRLDITGYTLNAFYESYVDILREKLTNEPSLSVRILLVDPKSKFAADRAGLEDKKRSTFEESVRRITSSFQQSQNVEIRLLKSPLTTMIFRIDDVMFVGPHFYRKLSKSTLTLELVRSGWLFDEYDQEFARLWANSVDLQIEQVK